MRELKRTLALTGCLVFLFTAIAAGGGMSERLTGTFSDLQYNSEGGDLLGAEVRIVMGKDHYQGTIQIAEGGISELGVFNVLTDTGKIVFDVPLATYAGHFVGQIKNNKLVGVLTFKDGQGDPMKLSLPRKKSYWD